MPAPDALLTVFGDVAATMPWYRELLAEAGVSPDTIRTAADVLCRCPVLTKENTFGRFPLASLAARTPLRTLAGVLTSSGHGGRFSFGLSTRAEAQAADEAIDTALDAAFDVRRRPTLAINALPMGVTFASGCMTVATTSVREDMVVGLVDAFGASFEQVLLVADPLFLKRLIDYTAQRRFDWRRYRLQVVVGEEVFGEHFRTYVHDHLGLDSGSPDGPWLMSSFGIGELGLHLLHETRATVALRRLAATNPAFAADLPGGCTSDAAPMWFTYEPRRLHPEVVDPGADGFGALAISMLDTSAAIPLLRYRTGDAARIVHGTDVDRALAQHALTLPGSLPERLVLVRGRERERLPNGVHMAAYKDAVYAVPAVADRLSGAVRMEADGTRCVMHVQLAHGQVEGDGVAEAIRGALPRRIWPDTIRVWQYERFPYGLTLDYERKFVGYAPADVT